MMMANIRGALRGVVDFPRRKRQRSEWEHIRYADGAAPVLGLGGLLAPGRFVHGGAVKLLSLRDAMTTDEERFNVLYLVSSAQPEFAEDLVAACRRQGIKFVWNQNGVGYPGWAGAEAARHNVPMRKLRAAADFVVYQSEFCRSSAGRFLGLCANPSVVLLNPVDLTKFTPRQQPLPFAPLRLLAMGTQNYRQRVVAVLDCVRALRRTGLECTLTVAGPLLWRNAETDLGNLIEQPDLAGAVSVRPAFGQDEAPAIYREHHILVHPKYLDPCPTVVAEALACGLPVVGSRSGGIPEMTDPECAGLIDVPLVWDRLITPSGDELAGAVRRIAGDLADASRAARRRAESLFDARRWVETHREIFQNLLA